MLIVLPATGYLSELMTPYVVINLSSGHCLQWPSFFADVDRSNSFTRKKSQTLSKHLRGGMNLSDLTYTIIIPLYMVA